VRFIRSAGSELIALFVADWLQIPSVDPLKEAEKRKDASLTDAERMTYATAEAEAGGLFAAELRAELNGRGFQKLLADVYRHVTLGTSVRTHLIQNDACFGRAAGAKLDERTRAHGCDDLGDPLLQQCSLRAGQIILRKLGDLLEQLGAALVVEVFGR